MILVTGATGNTGSEVVKALLALGQKPRVLARNAQKAVQLLGEDVDVAEGDFADAASVAEALKGVKTAFLLSPPALDTVAVQSAFVDAAKRAGVKHVVKLSAVGSAPGAPHRFGDWHGRVEKHIESSGMSWTHLRPTFFMQNFAGVAGMIKAGTIYMPTGEGRAPFVDVADIGAVAARVLAEPRAHAGKAYDVTGPQALSYGDVAATFSKVLGHPVAYVDVPPEAAKKGMTDAGMPEWTADAINELSARMKQGAFAKVSDVVEKVGRKAPTTLEQYVRRNMRAFS